MKKCKVCGSEFLLKKENHYLCKGNVSVSDALNGKKGIVYEAFDCPICGCQNIVNERYVDRVSV